MGSATGTRRGWRWIALVATASIVSGSGFAYASSESSTPQAWTVAPQVLPGQLNGVSCLGPNRCVAVGAKSTPGPLVEMGNGDNWTVTSAPSAGRTTLNAVSCISMKHCFAVGSSSSGGNEIPTVEGWNGEHWSIEPSPSPVGGSLTGVSCASDSFCVAVGGAGTSESLPLAEVWNGTRWSDTPTAPLPLDWSGMLRGVSCTTTTDCFAVGSTTPTDLPMLSLAERWDGVRWSIVSTPAQSFVSRELRAVSCVSATACVAVGDASSNNGGGPLVERWNGSAWTIQSSPEHPHYFFSTTLLGVSCASSFSCVAVGVATDENPRTEISRTWIERWDGETWSPVASPQPAGLHSSNWLSDVSCTSEHCEAVGYFTGGPVTSDTLRISGVIPRQSVSVSWTPAENARLQQVAAYLHAAAPATQKRAVYLVAYLLGLHPTPPTAATLPTMGSAASYTTVWAPDELPVLDAVRTHYHLDAQGATRLSVYLLSYLLALGGH